jgi:Ca2+-binding RTX toxin-like protein
VVFSLTKTVTQNQRSFAMGTYKFSNFNHIDSLLESGRKWGKENTGTGALITYRFSNRDNDFYTPHTPIQRERIRDAFNAWSEVANVVFADVTNVPSTSSQITIFGGGGQTRSRSNRRGIFRADVDIANGDDLPTGSFSYGCIALHEIGHALGLKHPHERGHNGFNVTANSDIDWTLFTVMSYRSYVGQPDPGILRQSFHPTTPMLHDIAAIQHIYSANLNTRSGDSVYQWNPGQQLLETIWDAGGIDTIDWSNQFTDAVINLNAGEWSQLGSGYTIWRTDSTSFVESRTLAIAYGITIENAIGGVGNDTIIGNSANNFLQGGDGNDNLNGGAGNDILDGGLGDDFLHGLSGDDQIYGGDGNDFLFGWDGNDQMYGGNGNDWLEGLDGNDQLYGGFGDDQIYGDSWDGSWTGGSGNDSLYGEEGNDALFGGLGNDVLHGGIGDDSLNGGEEADFLFGETGNDSLDGGFGNDYLYGGDGNDSLNGWIGDDYLSGGEGDDVYIINSVGDIILEYTNQGIDTVEVNLINNYSLGDNLENLRLYGDFTINGYGNNLNNTIQGNAANNTLLGALGNDTLIGGDSNDILYGDYAEKTYQGRLYLLSAPGDWNKAQAEAQSLGGNLVTINDSAEQQWVAQEFGTSELLWIGLNDFAQEGIWHWVSGEPVTYQNWADGEPNNSDPANPLGEDYVVMGWDGSRWNDLSSGWRTFRGIIELSNISYAEFNRRTEGNDILDGGTGNDFLVGGAGIDQLNGGTGDDVLVGGAGIDQLDGGDGIDTADLSDIEIGVIANLAGGTFSYSNELGVAITEVIRNIENLIGTQFNDNLIGNQGATRLEGGAGNDTLSGGDGNDTLLGGAGDDLLSGGNGIDFVDGGDGFDRLRLEEIQFGVRVDLNTDTMTYRDVTGNLVTETFRNLEGIIGGQFDDELIGHISNGATLDSRGGNDTLRGGAGNDDLSGGDGDDILFGEAGNDLLSGGNGIDFVDGGDGFDWLRLEEIQFGVKVDLNTDTTTYQEATGNLVTETFRNIEGVIGGQFDDELIGDEGNNEIQGRGGNDTFWGGAGNDYLSGDDGNDILAGGSGSLNYLSGNAGSDIFVVAIDGFSQALDFELGIDKIGLSGNLTVNQLKIEQGTGVNSSGTWIKLVSDNTNLMLLNGVQASALTTVMFLPASSYQSSLLV